MNPQTLFTRLTQTQKYFVFSIFGLAAAALVLVVLLTAAGGAPGGHRNSNSYGEGVSVGMAPMPPMADRDMGMGYSTDGFATQEAADESYRAGKVSISPTMPAPMQPYVPNLEAYETTDYRATALTNAFDPACGLLREMKADSAIHYRSFSEDLNHCSAVFFVDEGQANNVRDRLSGIENIVIERSTVSVTRAREDILDQVDVLRAQLAHTEATLATVTRQYEDIVKLAYQEGEPTALNRAIQSQYEILDQLNQRRLNEANQLRWLLQQSTDLEERIGKVQFSVDVRRTTEIAPDRFDRAWAGAFEDLKDNFIQTLISLTIGLGMFALWLVQLVVYGGLLLLIGRFLYRFLRRNWQR